MDAEPKFCLIVSSREYPRSVVLPALLERGFSPVEVTPQSWRAIYGSLNPVLTIAFVDASNAQDLGELTELSEELPKGTLLAIVPAVEQVPYVVAAGTNDFLTDNILEAALSAQLAAMTRSVGPDAEPNRASTTIELGTGMRIELGSRRLIGPVGTVSLSPFEMSLLEQLAERRGHAIPARILLSIAKGEEATDFDASRTVKTYVRRIRKKFETVGANQHLIATVRGVGYMMEQSETIATPGRS